MSAAPDLMATNVAPPRRRWGLWAAFAVVAALLVLLAVGMTRDPRQLSSVLIGQPWPERALPLLELLEWSLKKRKPVVWGV